MTNEQINAAIAEACGWNNEPVVCTDGKGRVWVTNCPDYCNDLNAMHEAEKTLAPKNWNNFSENWWIYCKLLRVNDADEAVHSTARQRAEAFLRTLGKWEEATDKDSLTVGATTEESSAVQSTSSGGAGGASTYGGKGLGIAGAAWPPETRITVNGKTFCLADIDKEMTE